MTTFTRGPFRGRFVESLSDRELSVGLHTLPPSYHTEREVMEHERHRRRAAREQRWRAEREAKQRRQDAERTAATEKRRQRERALLARMSSEERGLYASGDRQFRHNLLDAVERQLKHEVEVAERKAEKARIRAEKLREREWKARYANEHPDADEWEVAFAWWRQKDGVGGADTSARSQQQGVYERPLTPEEKLALTIIAEGRRSLAKRHHPDLDGGDADEMEGINRAADHLEKLVRRPARGNILTDLFGLLRQPDPRVPRTSVHLEDAIRS